MTPDDAQNPVMAVAKSAGAQVRRGFVDVADGQVHYRACGLDGPGVPLLCLHQSPFSSLTYLEILPFLGAHRPTVALDTPGFGESFRPARKPAIADYADWIRQAASGLGFDLFDVMGLFTGAAIASDMGMRFQDQVRRLVLMGPPLFDEAQQKKYLAEAWPQRPRPDGSHLLPEWRRVTQRALPDVGFERQCDAFQEFWRGGGDAIWGEEAVSVYPLKETLPRITQPTLVIQPDQLLGHTEAASGLIPGVRRFRLEGVKGWSMMQIAPERIAEAANMFLDLPA